MVIIEGPLGKVLHTGDFRFSSPKMVEEVKHVDFLYLDNTFLTPDENFPTQKEAV